MHCGKVNDQQLIRLREGIKAHDEPIGMLPDRAVERRPQIFWLAHVETLGLHPRSRSPCGKPSMWAAFAAVDVLSSMPMRKKCPRLLRLGAERRDDGYCGQEEAATVHAGTVGSAMCQVKRLRPSFEPLPFGGPEPRYITVRITPEDH